MDAVTAEDGTDVDFGRRRGQRPVRVVPTKTAILALLGGLAAGGVSVGGVTLWAAKAFIAEQVHAHDRDPEAHGPLVRAAERWRDSQAVSDDEKNRLRAQLDALSRDVKETREAVIRLEAQLKQGRGR